MKPILFIFPLHFIANENNESNKTAILPERVLDSPTGRSRLYQQQILPHTRLSPHSQKMESLNRKGRKNGNKRVEKSAD